LTVALNQPDHYVSLRKLMRTSAGRTVERTSVHDIRIDLRAEVVVSRGLTEAQASALLDASIDKAPRLHQRAARYFALGAAEDDQLKKFLFFFLSLEVETHAVFKRINHFAMAKAFVVPNESGLPRASAVALLARDIGNSPASTVIAPGFDARQHLI
jgi:hypothetical protein